MRAFTASLLVSVAALIATTSGCGSSDASSEAAAEAAQVGRSCRTNADCSAGAKYCAPNESGALVCQAKVDTGSGACGRAGNALGIGKACEAGACTASPGANVCVDAPELDSSFCSRTCTIDAECGANAFCAKASTTSGNVCIPYSCACAADTETSRLLAQALAPANRTTCDLGQRFGSLAGVYRDSIAHDAFRPTIYQQLYHAPMAIPHAGRRLADAARAAKDGAFASGPIREAARLWDEELPPGPAASPAASTVTFEDAVLALSAPATGSARAALASRIAADAADLPAALRSELAPILVAIEEAIDLRSQAIPAGTDLDRWFRAPLGMFAQMREVIPRSEKVDLSRASDRTFLTESFRYDLLVKAAVVVSEAIERSQLRTRKFPGTFTFNHETPFGRIVIRGSGNDTYTETALGGDLLLVVDTGGDDRYEIPVGATQSPSNPVSVAIDLGGKDTYTYVKTDTPPNDRPAADAAGRRPTVPRHSLSEVRRQGSGTLGIGMSFDFGNGDDLYESLRFSQGSGMLGVGVLYDEGGNDRYVAETVAQGGAHFGLGLLIDGAGNDSYRGYSVTQGAVYVKAVGMLLDYEGDDVYWTSPGNAYIGEPGRIAGHDYFYEYGINQGAAWGRRGDYPQDGIQNDGHASGGVGALLDLGGSDKYTCGAFCQGTGYWFGTGILWDDGAGNDETYGRIFAAASGVHFGLGVYHDGGGDDRHHIGAKSEGLTFGSGDDLSLAWFEDLGGNDRYAGGRHSFGSGTEKGVGIFVDLSGDDAYASSRGDGFGTIIDPADWHAPSHPRYKLASSAVFADGAGTDTYERVRAFQPDPLANAKSWVYPWLKDKLQPNTPMPASPSYTSPTVFGVGIDR